METKTNIYQKLLVIQTKVSGLAKDKKGNNFSYVTGDKLLSFIKPLMNEQGLLLKQEVLSIDNIQVDYKTGIGTQYEKSKSEINSKVMMRFTWVDCETGDKDENLFGANGQNDWDKGVGSALTYGERYFLLKYFHIATDEDDVDAKQEPPTPSTPQPTKEVAPLSTTTTGLPPLLDTPFKAMLEAIAKGEGEKVRAAMSKYTLLQQQLEILLTELNKTK